MATIRWVNRGDDGFGGVFGTQAGLARKIVDAAIDDWERVILDFNYLYGNTFDLYVNMESGGEGWGAVTSPYHLGLDLDFGFDPSTASPTEGAIKLQRGADINDDGRGDGAGYYLDPSFDLATPRPTIFNSTEFTSIVNAFVANVSATRPPGWVDFDTDGDGTPDGLFDFYTLVTHEIGHAVGFNSNPLIDFEGDFAVDTEVADQQYPAGTYWVWDSPRLGNDTGRGGALLTDANGSGTSETLLFSGPVHTAEPFRDSSGNAIPFMWNGRRYYGFDDLLNPRYDPNQRRLIPNHIVAMLADAHDYEFLYPSTHGTFYAILDPDTGVLTIRGGVDVSLDSVRIRGYRSANDGRNYLSVSPDVEMDWTTWLIADSFKVSSNFLADAVTRIDIDLGNGTDIIRYDNDLTAENVTIVNKGGGGSILLHNVAAGSDIEIRNETPSAQFIEIGKVGVGANVEIASLPWDTIQLGWYRDNGHDRSLPQEEMLGKITVRPSLVPSSFNDAIGTIVVNHADTFDVGTNSMSHAGGGRVVYSGLRSLQMNLKPGSTRTTISGLPNTGDLAIDATRIGSHNIEFSPDSRSLALLRGNVDLLGNSDDQIVIHDDLSPTSNYRIETPEPTLTTTRFTKHSSSFAIDIRGIRRATLHTSDQGSTTEIQGTTFSTGWSIEGGLQNDRVVLFGTVGSLVNLPIGLDFHGNGGFDELFVNNGRSSSDHYYTFETNQFVYAQGLGGIIRHSDIDVMRLFGGTRSDTFTVNASAFGTNLQLFGGDGTDTFNIGQGNLFDEFQGDIFIDGGTGTDRINLLDADASVEGGYVFGTATATDRVLETTFRKFLIKFIPVSFPPFIFPITYQTGQMKSRGIERIDLQGSAQDDFFDINGTPAGMTYNLFGNDGDDDFRINGSRLLSRINVRGGLPTTAPGDRLRVYGTSQDSGSYLPGGTADSGQVTVRGQVIDFTGLEPVYVEGFGTFNITTPRSKDRLTIGQHIDPVDDRLWTEVRGTSGLLDTPFETLRARDIGTLEIVTLPYDFVPEPAPLNSFNPNDIIDILPDALGGNRVGTMRMIVGGGSDTIVDRTLLGQPATTMLEIVSITGGTRYGVLGQPYRVEIGTPGSGVATMRAFSGTGTRLHEARLINTDDVLFASPQINVEYVGSNVEVTLEAGETLSNGTRLQSLRTDLAPTEFQFDTTANSQFTLRISDVSTVAIIAILRTAPILRGGSGQDVVTLNGASLGNYGLTVRDFDARDTLRLTLPTMPGNGNFFGLDFSDPQQASFAMIGDPRVPGTDPRAIPTLPMPRGVTRGEVLRSPTGELPTFEMLGDPDADANIALVNAPPVSTSLPVLAEVNLAAIELLVFVGPEAIVGPDANGATVRDRDNVRVTSDSSLGEVIPDTISRPGDLGRVEVNVRPASTNLTNITPYAIELLVYEGPGDLMSIQHFITRSFDTAASRFSTIERVVAGDVTIRRSLGDDPLNTTLQFSNIASKIDDGDYPQDFDLDFIHTGSTSTCDIQGTFHGRLGLSVEGALSNNRVAIFAHDSEFLGGFAVEIDSPASGTTTAVIGETGVYYGPGSYRDVRMTSAGAETLLFQGDSDVRTAPGVIRNTDIELDGASATILSAAGSGLSTVELYGIIAILRELEMPIDVRYQSVFELLPNRFGMVGQAPAQGVDAFRTIDITGTGDIAGAAYDAQSLTTVTAGHTGAFDMTAGIGVEIVIPGLDDIELPPGPVHLSTVTDTGDSGPGSLRAALESALMAPGETTALIGFAIPVSDPNFRDVDSHLPGGDLGPDTFVITPLTALPVNYRGKVVINGASQKSFTGDTNSFGPEIVLAGHLAGPAANGLEFRSFENRVHSLNIQGFGGNGVLLSGYANVVTGSYIGTNATGTSASANGGSGIKIVDGAGSVIGGSSPSDRNVISGNSLQGVHIIGNGVIPPITDTICIDPITGLPTSCPPQIGGNTVLGNYIGTTADGMGRLGNDQNGVYLENSAHNLIGGAETDARNVISDNTAGVTIIGPNATGNRVLGNFIGLTVSGEPSLGNRYRGVAVIGGNGLQQGAPGNFIGGPESGSGNVISGSPYEQLFIAGTRGTIVQGNRIGTNAAGTATGAYAQQGIRVEDDLDSLIGGTQTGEGNLISSSYYGIYVNGRWVPGGTQRLTIQGNRIGTDRSGAYALANFQGIYIDGYEGGNLRFESHDIRIGGSEPGAGNLISGNQNAGIIVRGPNLSGISIQGNLVGTDTSGDRAIPNGPNGPGILLDNVSGVLVGGSAEGAGNVISGNTSDGIRIVGGSGNYVQKNIVGLNSMGESPLANSGNGVHIVRGSNGNQILDNVISANRGSGLYIEGSATTGNILSGNLIGTDSEGEVDRGNAIMGVWIINSAGNTVRENLISGNDVNGLVIAGASASGNLAEGNYIGTDVSGTSAIGNVLGIHLADAPNNVVRGNLLSGNLVGLDISGSPATGNVVTGNFIGTTASGNAPLPNRADGIFIDDAPGNRIGGSGPGEGNVIGANGFRGIYIDGTGSTDNVVTGNRIGLGANGLTPLGNLMAGIEIAAGASRNRVGTNGDGVGDALEGNRIANNGGAGVSVVGDTSRGNTIRGNAISANGGLGIDLGTAGVNTNDTLDSDTGANDLQNHPVIDNARNNGSNIQINGLLRSTPNSRFHVDFYANETPDSSGYGEGRRWIGSIVVQTDATGFASYQFTGSPDLAIRDEWVSATATAQATGSTSEFSNARQVLGRPAQPPGRGPGRGESSNASTSGLVVLDQVAVDALLPNLDSESSRFRVNARSRRGRVTRD